MHDHIYGLFGDNLLETLCERHSVVLAIYGRVTPCPFGVWPCSKKGPMLTWSPMLTCRTFLWCKCVKNITMKTNKPIHDFIVVVYCYLWESPPMLVLGFGTA